MNNYSLPRVKYWRNSGSLITRFRRWFLYRILCYQTETCDKCGGKVNLVWWSKENLLWEEVYKTATGNSRGDSGLLCSKCFDKVAYSIGYLLIWNPTPDPQYKKSKNVQENGRS